MKLYIYSDVCTGCGVCETIFPAMIIMGEDRSAHVLDGGIISQEGRDLALDIIKKCPVQAIVILDE